MFIYDYKECLFGFMGFDCVYNCLYLFYGVDCYMICVCFVDFCDFYLGCISDNLKSKFFFG